MLELGTRWKVFAPFCDAPTASFSLRELARRTDLAHTSITPHLDALVKEGLLAVHEDRQGKRSFTKYVASRTATFFTHKRFHNQMVIQDSGLIPYLRDAFLPRCVVLFGSYERGEDTEDSDIDLFLEAKPKDVDVRRYERVLHRKIQLHIKPAFTTYPDELKNNILNGTTLAGFLEAFR